MKEKFKRIMLQIFATHIGRILLGAILMIVGGIMTPFGTIGELIYDYDQGGFWKVLFYIGIALLVGESLIMMAYAWVINPIRALKERKNKK